MARRHGRGRRGRRFGVLYKLLTLVVVCAAAVLALTLFFKVESVEVTGNSRYSAQEIQDACGVQLGDNLYLLSKPDMVQRLHQQLPYIDEVRITRRLPNTLCVQVTEFSTVYAVEQVEGAVMLDAFRAAPGVKYALVFGNEVDGVGQEAVDRCDGAVEIPQAGTKHSVNVSVSGGVVLWSFFCQIRPKR